MTERLWTAIIRLESHSGKLCGEDAFGFLAESARLVKGRRQARAGPSNRQAQAARSGTASPVTGKKAVQAGLLGNLGGTTGFSVPLGREKPYLFGGVL